MIVWQKKVIGKAGDYVASSFNSIGRIGQKRTGGIFYEEFLRELQGKKGIETYREMSENDDVIGALLYAIRMLIRHCSWDVQPGGETSKDEEASWFVWNCLNDMTSTWGDTLSEILSMLVYGWSAHEVIYKRRMGSKRDKRYSSKFDDGLIGWRDMPIRAQETLYEWVYDSEDNLLGMKQLPPPDYGIIEIPKERLLLFRTENRKGNPEGRSILRNAYRCFDEKTEILTADGWKYGMDLSSDDILATLNPDTKELEYQKPEELNFYQHNGEMIHVHSRFLDVKVTPNHRMWVKKDKAKDFCIIEASELKNSHSFMSDVKWSGKREEQYVIPKYEVWQRSAKGNLFLKEVKPEVVVDMDAWLAYLGLYLSEGCTTLNKRGQAYVSITQKEGVKSDRIRQLLSRMPFHVYEHKGENNKVNFEICDRRLYNELKVFGKSWQKYVPKYVKTLCPEQINIFLDWYVFGDGGRVGGGAYKGKEYRGTDTIGTTSEQMADDIQELAFLAGWVSQKYLKQPQKNRYGKRPFYIISLGKPMHFKAKNITKEQYNGRVWCPTTKNGIVYVRRNGKATWVGNCWYFKKRIQEIEGIGIERDLAGLPVLTPDENLVDLWDDTNPDMVRMLDRATDIVTKIRRDALEGIVLPSGWKLELLTTGGRRQFDTSAIIERYDSRMAMTVLADFILLGHQNVGSFALSTNKSRLFSLAVGAYLNSITEVFNNQAIPDLINLNAAHFAGITDYPKLTHGEVDEVDLTALGAFVKDMAGIGGIVPDTSLEDYLRDASHLPPRTEDNDGADS